MRGELARFYVSVVALQLGANNDRIIEHINKHEGVEWVTFEQMCDEFKSKNKPPEGARMPEAPMPLKQA